MKKVSVICLLVILLITGYVFADSLNQTIEVIFNKVSIQVEGKPVMVDNFLHNNKTYVPLGDIKTLFNKDIEWNGSTFTANIVDKVKTVKPSKKIHTYYAINSKDQFDQFIADGSIERIDSMSFAWGTMEFNEQSEEPFLNMGVSNNNSLFLPKGYEEFVSELNDYDFSKQLSIYSDADINKILTNKEKTAQDIIDAIYLTNDFQFDGVVIDFERLTEKDSAAFISFLEFLAPKIKAIDKTLYVAVKPNAYDSAYNYREISKNADYIILMAHDYDIKQVNKLTDAIEENNIYSPVAPYSKVIRALERITNEQTGVLDSKKVLLQLNLATSQWKFKDGELYDNDGTIDNIVRPNFPTYDMLYDRIITEKIRRNNSMLYDDFSRSPYLKYYTENDGTLNIVWYEDTRSIDEKLEALDRYNLGGISVWRIGNIPNYYEYKDGSHYLNVWDYIMEKYKQD